MTGTNRSLLQGGDQWGYNSYLTSIFIYKDLKTLDKTYEATRHQSGVAPRPAGSPGRIGEAPDAPNGNRILKYSYGVAALQAPFFIASHLLLRGNGYSPGYVYAVYLSTIFYVLIGLLLLMRVLAGFVNPRSALFSLLLLLAGTNLLYFTSCNPGLSHPYLFFLFSCMLYYTDQFYKLPSTKHAIIMGVLAGLIVVTRPVEIIVLLSPLVFIARHDFIREHYRKIMLSFLFAGLVILPQLVYWKTVSGQWLYDTYPTERFDFLHPHIIEGFFSFKNGWFAYTPLMIIAIPGLLLIAKKKNPFATGIILYTLLTIYITYSWTQWNYNAGLGSRPMVEAYALLAIPFAIFLQYIFQYKKARLIAVVFIPFCVYINILRTIQMQTGNFISEDATWQFNRQMLFKLHASLGDVYAFDLNFAQPDSAQLQFSKQLGVQNFESETGAIKDTMLQTEGFQSAVFEQNEFNDLVEVPIDSSYRKGDYIKVSAWARVSSNVNHYRMGKIVVEVIRSGKSVQWNSVRIHNKLMGSETAANLFHGVVNEWRKMEFYILLENNFLRGDILKVYGWNPLHESFRLDDMQVAYYKRKY
ncbi:MAG: hypothetical protein ABI581_01370 [Sediminibacterium sp.]